MEFQYKKIKNPQNLPKIMAKTCLMSLAIRNYLTNFACQKKNCENLCTLMKQVGNRDLKT